MGWWGAKSPLLKICHAYTLMMKFGSCTLPKEDPKKYINHVTHPHPRLTKVINLKVKRVLWANSYVWSYRGKNDRGAGPLSWIGWKQA